MKEYDELQKILINMLGSTQYYGRSIFTILGGILLGLGILGTLSFGWFSADLLLITVFLGAVVILEGNKWLIQKRDEMIMELRILNYDLYETHGKVDSIEVILRKIDRIHDILGSMKFNRIFTDFLYSDKLHEEQLQIFDKEIQLLLLFMHDLKNDLTLRVQKEQEALFSAQGEISTTESKDQNLQGVIDLQEKRINEQIEQFEELQRVLVKV